MVTIPTALNLGTRSVPQSNRAIASYDGSAGAQGLIAAGKQVAAFGADASKVSEERNKELENIQSAQDVLAAMQSNFQTEEYAKNNPGEYAKFSDIHKANFDAVATPILEKYKDNPVRQQKMGVVLQKEFLESQQRLSTLGHSYEADQRVAHIVQSGSESKSRVAANPDAYDAELQAQNFYTDASAARIGADKAAAQKVAIRRDLTETRFNAIANREGYAAAYAKVRQEIAGGGAIGSPVDVIMKNELHADGIVRVHSDGDGSAIGGINSVAFPEQFAEASRILRDDGQDAAKGYIRNFYQSEIVAKGGIDKLSPDVQDVVADGLVNHWSGFQTKLLDAAKGGASRQQLLDMRQAEYDRLAATGEKKYTSAKAGWDKRISGLRGGGAQSKYDPDVLQTLERQYKPIAQAKVKEAMALNVTAAENGLAVTPILEDDLRLLESADDPDFLSKHNNALETARQSYQFMDMSQADINKALVSARPTDPANVKQYEVLQAAAAKASKAQLDAPIETAMKVDPTIRALSDMAATDPTLYPAYFDALDKKYTQWGVNPKFKYISKPQSEALAADIDGAVAKGGSAAAMKLKALYDTYGGQRFGDVMADIAPSLSGSARVAASIYDATNPRVSEDLLNIAGVKTEDLSSALLPSDAKVVRDDVTKSLAPLQQTLLGTNPGAGAATFADFREQTLRLAYSYVAKGKSATEAAKLAAAEIAIGKYYFTDSNRIPNAFDPVEVQTGMRTFANTLKSSDLIIPDGYKRVPDTYIGAIASNAKWVNNENETGLILVDDYGNRVRYKDGSPVDKSFGFLSLHGVNANKSADQMKEQQIDRVYKETGRRPNLSLFGE